MFEFFFHLFEPRRHNYVNESVEPLIMDKKITVIGGSNRDFTEKYYVSDEFGTVEYPNPDHLWGNAHIYRFVKVVETGHTRNYYFEY